MNAIVALFSQPWVERLGWTLLHFLWQGLVLGGLHAAARRGMPRSSANARYLAACLTLGAMLAAPVATYIWLGPPAENPIPRDATARILQLPPQPAGAAVLLTALANVERDGGWIEEAARWSVAIWFCGAALFWLRLAGGWWVAGRMRSLRVRPAPAKWQENLRHLCARMRLTRPVQLLISARVAVPTVVGGFRPVILAPLGALSGLPADHIEALLLHELAHIRRHDYLVNVVQSIAEALLFYHPAVWRVSGHIRSEREMCCDDLAVAATGDAALYAMALTDLEGCRPAHLHGVVAANGGRLAERIARLLGESREETRMVSPWGAAAGAVLLTAAACVVFGQTAERPKFEVASVKPNEEKVRNIAGMRPMPGGGLHAQNATVSMMMMNAYQLQEYQIVGGPAWLHDVGFDIEAKGGANASRAQVMLMLQSLLEDRFQLKYHRETRTLPVFALTALRGGTKLAPPKPGGCTPQDGLVTPVPGQRPPAPCGSMNLWGVPGGMHAVGGDVAIGEFIRVLSMVLGRPVLDQTGVGTHFDVDFVFSVDDMAAGLMMSSGSVDGHHETMAAAAAAANDPKAAPNIVAAVQESMGLKLETSKGPVEVLVVDRVEKPSGN